jgi:hypothetical protein
MYPWVKSVVWRSDAIPQVSQDVDDVDLHKVIEKRMLRLLHYMPWQIQPTIIKNEMFHGLCAHLGLHDNKYVVDTESESRVIEQKCVHLFSNENREQ